MMDDVAAEARRHMGRDYFDDRKEVADAENEIKFVYVEGGTYRMGSEDGDFDERPVRRVALSSFYISQTEITQAQWESVMESNPSRFRGDERPVERVTWFEALRFCNAISKEEQLDTCYVFLGDNVIWNIHADGYRLPTEAEWEYAARGGLLNRGYSYSGGNDANTVAWFSYPYAKSTYRVAKKTANELGLYDMNGNVWEWCWDKFGTYPSSPQADPQGPVRGEYRVLRGGGWRSLSYVLSCTNRCFYLPTNRAETVGFRCVRQ